MAHPLPDRAGGAGPTKVATEPPSPEPARAAGAGAGGPAAALATRGPVEETAAPVVRTIEEVLPVAAPITRSILREADRLLDELPTHR